MPTTPLFALLAIGSAIGFYATEIHWFAIAAVAFGVTALLKAVP